MGQLSVGLCVGVGVKKSDFGFLPKSYTNSI